jgi:hypothetical protein
MKKRYTAIGDRAHLFIDIVGYSKLLINQQSERRRELNEIVSSTNHYAQT